jgi:uncharacterized membrane protein YcaP (DUF421 family)
MVLVAVALRVSIAYVYLLILLRLTGKRTVRQGTPFDLLVALLLGDLPDDIVWGEVPLARGLVAVGVVVLLHTVVGYLSSRSIRFDRLIGSGATPVMAGGRLLRDGLRRQHVNDHDLDARLRLYGLGQREDVREAFVEPSGTISAIEHEAARPAERRDRGRLAEALR